MTAYPAKASRQQDVLSPEEHHVVSRYVAGASPKQIADEDGTPVAVVSKVLQRRAARAYIDDVQDAVRQYARDRAVRIAEAAMDVLERLMTDDEAPHSVRLAAATQALDRAGVPKTPDVAVQNNTTINLGDVRSEVQRAVAALDDRALGLE